MNETRYKCTESGGKSTSDRESGYCRILLGILSLFMHDSPFTVIARTRAGRRGRLQTPHGTIETPFFLPVATAGAMKGVTFSDLHQLGYQALLCNTYHLHITPGETIVRRAGGLHEFIGWKKPILTDSGGFQVFSLSSIRSIDEDGVRFRNHRSGAEVFLGPVESLSIQHALGSDIIMCFDECPPSKAPKADQIRAVDRTLRWAALCRKTHETLAAPQQKKPLLFGIVQGGLHADLRKKCAEELQAIGFDGYAIGGLAVGETEQEMYSVLDLVCPLLPEEKPRYLMGVGERHQHREAIARGVDMFDCVSPMREARHGMIWLTDGGKIRIRRAENSLDDSPLDPLSTLELCRNVKKSYLHHLFRIGERYGETIACLQNMAVTKSAMDATRKSCEH